MDLTECPSVAGNMVSNKSINDVLYYVMMHILICTEKAGVFNVRDSHYAPVDVKTGPREMKVKKLLLVLYGSETGTSESYAYETAACFRSFDCKVGGTAKRPVECIRTTCGTRPTQKYVPPMYRAREL